MAIIETQVALQPRLDVGQDTMTVAPGDIAAEYAVQNTTTELSIKGIMQAGCETCISACCRKGVALALSEVEVEFMRESGSTLTEVAMPRKRKLPLIGRNKPKVYLLDEDCGNLVQDAETGRTSCAAYINPNKPKICDDFQAGSYYCRSMRVSTGVDSSEAFLVWKRATSC